MMKTYPPCPRCGKPAPSHPCAECIIAALPGAASPLAAVATPPKRGSLAHLVEKEEGE